MPRPISRLHSRSSLKRRRLRALTIAPLLIFAWFAPSSASAASYTVSEESDLYFSIESDNTLVVIYGNSNSPCSGSFADPYLWVYEDGPESSGALVAQNDDGNHNSNDQCVSSKIYTTLNAGDYRLRAGYCCSQGGLGYNPSGYDYEIVTDLVFDNVSPNTPTATTTTTTTVPQTVGDPTNLTLAVDYSNGTVTADWDAPADGNIDPERYAIGFGLNDDGNAGPYGVATGNVGDENALITEYTFSAEYIELLFNEAHGLFNVNVRSDNDTNAVYSGWTPVSSITIMNMPDVVDNQSVAQIQGEGVQLSWDASFDGFVDPHHYAISYNSSEEPLTVYYISNISSTSHTISYSDIEDGTWFFNILACGSENDCNVGETIEVSVYNAPPPTTTTTTTTLPPTTTSTSTTSTTLPTAESSTSTTTLPPTTTTTSTTVAPTTTTTEAPPSTTTTSTTVAPSTSTTSVPPTTTTTTTLPATTTVPTTLPVATTTTATTSTTSTSTSTSTTTTTTTLPPSLEKVSEVLKASNPDAVINVQEIDEAELKVIEEVLEVIDNEELAGELAEVLDGEVTVEEVAALITDDDFEDLPDDAIRVVVNALNEADQEVKEEFEEEINVFEGDFDDYVPSGSAVDVETRRTVVAATAAVAVVANIGTGGPPPPAPAPAPSGGAPSGGSGGGTGGGAGGAGSGGGGAPAGDAGPGTSGDSGGAEAEGEKKSRRRRRSK